MGTFFYLFLPLFLQLTLPESLLDENRVELVLLEHHEVEGADAEGEEADAQGELDDDIPMQNVRSGVMHEEEEVKMDAELRQILEEECVGTHELTVSDLLSA